MADLTQTAANVGLSGRAVLKAVQVGEAVTQGQPAYLVSATGLYWRGDADDANDAVGIFLTPAATSGWSVLATSGSIDLGATLTVGETYCVSTNVGAIAPIGDLTTGDYTKILGVATATDALDLSIYNSGVAKP